MIRSLSLVAASSLLAAPVVAQSGIPPAWVLSDSNRVTIGAHAMVVSGQPLASQVGRDIMRQGGNAVDAAVAVGFALAVTHPHAGNIGGGGFMVIRMADGRAFALDYRERAPGKARRNMYQDAKGNPTDRSWTGHLAPGVPGSVAGLHEAHRKFGKLPWATVVAPAVALARDGFTVDAYHGRFLRADSARLSRFPTTRKIFLPGGAIPAAGTLWKQPDLGQTLTDIMNQGPNGFYRGRVARLIAEEMRRGGGIITQADLRAYRAEWRDPLSYSYRDHTIISMPPVSSGGVTLALILNQMEGFGPLPPFGSPELIHREAEAMRRAFMERNSRLGDPAFIKIPLERFLSKAHANELRSAIDPDRATPTPPFDPRIRDGNSTTHYSVVDSAGNAVSTTTTLNNVFGSAVTVAGAGFLLNDEMEDFATAPGKPNVFGLVEGEANAIAPGKRMLSSMTPSIVLGRDGNVLLIVGTPGGPTIITQVYHVISNVIDHGMDLPHAVAAPRFHHQALPDQIAVERGGYFPAVLQRLQAMGHKVVERDYMGDVEAILRIEGGWQGVSDPRRGGGGAGY